MAGNNIFGRLKFIWRKSMFGRMATLKVIGAFFSFSILIVILVATMNAILENTVGELRYASRSVWNIPGNHKVVRIGILSCYVPSESQLAALTADILRSLSLNAAGVKVGVLVLSKSESGDARFGSGASFVIRRNVLEDYFLAAEFSNSNYDFVICQHEFALYGGLMGDYVLGLLGRLQIPYISILSTLPSKAGSNLRDLNKYEEILFELLTRSSWVAVRDGIDCSEIEVVLPGVAKKCSNLWSGSSEPRFASLESELPGGNKEPQLLDLAQGIVSLCNFAFKEFHSLSREQENTLYEQLWGIRRAVGIDSRQRSLSQFLTAIRSADKNLVALEAKKLSELLKTGNLISQLALSAIQSLTYKGLIFSKWQPPSKEFRFNCNRHGVFFLRDTSKLVHGDLMDGAVTVSHAENGLVFGRGPAVSWPSVMFELQGLECQELDQRRKLTWGKEESSTEVTVWTQATVVCISKDEETRLAVLTNKNTARLNDPVVERTVELEFLDLDVKTDVKAVRVMTRFFQLSGEEYGKPLSQFQSLREDGKEENVRPGHSEFDLFRKGNGSALALYLLRNEAGRHGVFMATSTASKLESVVSWSLDMRGEPVVTEVEHRYLWRSPQRKKISLTESFMVTGGVDSLKLPEYLSLLKQRGGWPGVDFSAVEDKDELLHLLGQYAHRVGEGTWKGQALKQWMSEQGFSSAQ